MNQRSVAKQPGAVMVVGGAGFLGSHIVDRLLLDGAQVDVVDDLSTGSLANLSAARSSAVDGALRIHTLDVTIPEFVDVVRLRRPEAMYVTALLTPTMQDSGGCTKSYAIAIAIFEAAVQAKVRKVIVAIPAGVLYGEVPARDLPIKEDRERRPVGLPGVTAQAIIELCEIYRRDHDIEFTVLALPIVYGPRQQPNNNVVSAFVVAQSTDNEPEIFGDGKQTRDFLFVDDAADDWRRHPHRRRCSRDVPGRRPVAGGRELRHGKRHLRRRGGRGGVVPRGRSRGRPRARTAPA